MPSSTPRAEGAAKPEDATEGGRPRGEGPGGERIAKRMARAGLCSRREAEAWIAAGRVSVDGHKLTGPAVTVGPASVILVDGKALPGAEPARLFRYHKPDGLVTTSHAPEGMVTIYDKLPADLPRVMPVSALDLHAEGLLLLTNDGAMKRHMELHARDWLHRYRVRLSGVVDAAKLASLAQGLHIEGVAYGPIRAALDSQKRINAWVTVSLAEGKGRDIRKLCLHLGWTVSRLICTAYGPFQLGELPRGAIEEVPPKMVREQLGLSASRRAASPEATRPDASTSRAPRSHAPRQNAHRRRKV
jgi:23S rRNA pseudouridine2605 synthase